MARVKKTDAAPPPPKHWSEVKHGCCSCKYYKNDFKDKNSPCYPCTDWNYWEDAHPEKTTAMQAILHGTAVDAIPAPEQVESALERNTDTSKTAKRRTRKTAIVTEDALPSQEEPAVVPKKRPGRPKKTVSVPDAPTPNSETSATEQKKKPGRPKKTTSHSQEQTIASAETDQLSFKL